MLLQYRTRQEYMKCRHTKTHTQHFQVMGLKYDREWEPVYQAFLLLPLFQVAPANPERRWRESHTDSQTQAVAQPNITEQYKRICVYCIGIFD